MVSKSTTRPSKRVAFSNDTCNSMFRVPSYMVKSYGEKMPTKVSIRLDDSGKKWTLSVEKFKDQYFFTDGWKEFAEQGDLKAIKFLKFKNDKREQKRSGDVKATSSALDKDKGKNKKEMSSSEKATSSILRKDNGEGSGDANGTTVLKENKDKGSPVETMLSFSREMKYHHRYRVDFPKGFILNTGIQEGGKIKLKDDAGIEWSIQVTKRSGDANLSLSAGWCDFIKSNKVMLGSTISFTWLAEEDTLVTQIVDVGTSTQLLCSARKNT